jgi:protein TonB
LAWRATHPELAIPHITELVPVPHATAAASSSTAISYDAPRTRALVVPTVIPNRIATDSEDRDPAPFAAQACPSCTGSVDSQTLAPLLGRNSTPAMVVRPAPTVVKPVRISHMDEGMLLRRVQPQYPPLAKQIGVQGMVVLQAIISRTGEVESLRTISGHPILVGAALEAVRQWRYRPYVLNGAPIEVETQITVNFTLSNS